MYNNHTLLFNRPKSDKISKHKYLGFVLILIVVIFYGYLTDINMTCVNHTLISRDKMSCVLDHKPRSIDKQNKVHKVVCKIVKMRDTKWIVKKTFKIGVTVELVYYYLENNVSHK